MTHTHIIKDVLPGSIAEELEISGSLTVEYRKKPYNAYKKALFLSNFLNLLVLVCACYGIMKRKEVFLCM